MIEEGIIIHTDGGSRGNPGPAACAFVAEVDGEVVEKKSSYLGITTNNQAEYLGTILALNWLKQYLEKNKFSQTIFYLDSELVVRQLTGAYRVKDKKILEQFIKINEILKAINTKIFFKNVPREKNKIADYLVNKELDENLKK